MADDAQIIHFPQGQQKVARRGHKTALKRIGITEDSLLGNLVDLARDGIKTVTVRNGDGEVLTETITRDPAIRLKATEKLLDLIAPKPKSRQTMYAEKTEW